MNRKSLIWTIVLITFSFIILAGILYYFYGRTSIEELTANEGVMKSQRLLKAQLREAYKLTMEKRYNEAVKELQKLTDLGTEPLDNMSVCGLIQKCYREQNLKSGIISNARTAINKGQELLTSHPDAYHLNIYLGWFYSEIEDWENARKSYQNFIEAEAAAVKKDPTSRAQVHMRIAKIYENEQKWSAMVQEYQEVIDDYENPYKVLKAEAQFSTGQAYEAHGKEIFETAERAKKEAPRAYQQVIDLFPEKRCKEWRDKADERLRELGEKLNNSK